MLPAEQFSSSVASSQSAIPSHLNRLGKHLFSSQENSFSRHSWGSTQQMKAKKVCVKNIKICGNKVIQFKFCSILLASHQLKPNISSAEVFEFWWIQKIMSESMNKCFTNVVSTVKVAIFLIRLITTVVVVVAHLVPNNANPIGLAPEFAFLAGLTDWVSAVQLVIQCFETGRNSGIVYECACGDLFTEMI